jgi:hypothetical protein
MRPSDAPAPPRRLDRGGVLRVAVALVAAAWVVVAVAAMWPSHRRTSPVSPDADVRGAPLTGGRDAEVTAAPAIPAATAKDGTTAVSFDLLAGFVYDPPPLEYDADGNPKPADASRDPVPRAVRALSGRRVSVSGYMIPYNFTEGRCTKFALSKFTSSCCFGCTALPNNWIEVTMAEGTTAACANGELVRVVGVLQVAGLDEELATLYTITGETVAAEPSR